MRIALVLFLAAAAAAQVPDPTDAAQTTISLPPFTWRTRVDYTLNKFRTPQSLLDTVPGTLFNHAIDSPPEWDQAWEGLGRRMGSTYLQYSARETIELGLFAVRKEDPRYWRQGSGSLWSRSRNVLKSSLFAHTRDGRPTPAINSVIGIMGGRAVALTWLPPSRQGFDQVAISTGWGLLTKAAGNGFQEFWPDAKRLLFHRGKKDPLLSAPHPDRTTTP